MCGGPELPGEPRRVNGESRLSGQVVAQPCPVLQMRSLTAFGAIVDRIE